MNEKIKIAIVSSSKTYLEIEDESKRYEKSAISLNGKYDVTHFRYILRAKGLKQKYVLSVFKFLNLVHSLIKGRFHLFITGFLFTPESLVTFIVAKLLRRPIIVLDDHWYWPGTALGKFTWPIAILLARNSDLMLVTSLARLYWKSIGVVDDKLMTAPLQVSLLRLSQKDYLKFEELKKNFKCRKVVLYFGRLVKYKGVEYLVKSFAKLSEENNETCLIIAGEGERQRLMKLCRELKLDNRVHFTGFVKKEDKAALFLLCDVFVHPAIRLATPEEWGLAVNEAMSVGKPVVVTTAVGAKELVKNGVNGYIVPERNVDAIYNAIKILINNDDLRNKMGHAARRTIEQGYTYEHYIKCFEKAIRKAIKLSCSEFSSSSSTRDA
jgi:glycosyltransferase involved in cell wall biosynthesis